MNFTTDQITSRIYYKSKEIFPGMMIDLEWLKDSIYTYIYNGGIIKMRHNIYEICYYFDKLMMNAADITPLVQFMSEYSTHCDEIERKYFAMKRDIYKKFPEIFTLSFTDEPEINVMEPMERQTNAPPPELPINGLVIDFMTDWRDCTENKNRMFTAICSYINNISIKISYIKSQIIKMELARCGKMSGTALDIVIHELHNQFIYWKEEIRQYILIERTLFYDATLIGRCIYSQEDSIRELLYNNYPNCSTEYPYNLPRSVINECGDNLDLWNILCKERDWGGKILRHPFAK